LLQKPEKINIAGINISSLTEESMLELIESSVQKKEKLTIAYCNARTVNYVYRNRDFAAALNNFDITHPDGIGVYIASKFLFGSNGLSNRFSGSDFYAALIQYCISHKRKLFFFGHDNKTLTKIKAVLPHLNISGFQNGYEYDSNGVISEINSSETEILICGLGMPLQEEWILKHNDSLKCSVMICVGEGIKVFSGTKLRGPVLLRKMGLEWFIRFLSNPIKYFGRYILGNPLFLYRIIILKLRNLSR
jgi:N-acetylglucosaminyldiphosphoundecaprenol N-acetyl-beta-D-mannosaminyltransferase